MAKGKKKALTREEALERALVSEGEWPYRVPGNWVWTRLGNAVSPSYDKFDDFSSGREAKYVGLEHLERDSGIVSYGSANDVKSLKNIFSKGDILYGKLRPYLNKHDVVNFDGICSTDIMVLKPSAVSQLDFVNYYLDTDKFIQYAVANSKGINLPRISPDMVLNALFPLPPLPEQRRIVERIESLFEKLDRAKELAQNALDSFETRKAAILHKAFTGELTAHWREHNGVGMDSWECGILNDKFNIVSGIQKTPARAPRKNPIPYLSVANVLRGELMLEVIKYFEVTKSELEALSLRKSDLLVVEGNGSAKEIGRCAVWGGEIAPCVHQNHIIRLRAKDDSISSIFVLYFLNSERGKEIMREKAKTTAGLFNLSTGKIKEIPLSFPPLPEQQEIVRILDSLFEKEQRARELSDVIDKIDLMKKAILARAFRGELGTNDPSEESAVELLSKSLQ